MLPLDISWIPKLEARLKSRTRRKILPAQNIHPSAVVLVLKQDNMGWWLLLVEKSKTLKHHAGQISFPGGKQEKEDRTLEETALRELKEEVGIQEIQLLGKLDDHPTWVTPFVITPFVGWLHKPTSILIDNHEVEDYFWVPLDFLLQPKNKRVEFWEWRGKKVAMPFFDYKNKTIWGATGRILEDFMGILRDMDLQI